MAAPPEVTLQNLAGRWSLNKKLSDDYIQVSSDLFNHSKAETTGPCPARSERFDPKGHQLSVSVFENHTAIRERAQHGADGNRSICSRYY